MQKIKQKKWFFGAKNPARAEVEVKKFLFWTYETAPDREYTYKTKDVLLEKISEFLKEEGSIQVISFVDDTGYEYRELCGTSHLPFDEQYKKCPVGTITVTYMVEE